MTYPPLLWRHVAALLALACALCLCGWGRAETRAEDCRATIRGDR